MARDEACVRTREPEVWDRCALARWRSAARRPRDRAERVGDVKAAALPYRKEALRPLGDGERPGGRGRPSVSLPYALQGWPKPWLQSPVNAAPIWPLGLVQISLILQLRHRKKGIMWLLGVKVRNRRESGF